MILIIGLVVLLILIPLAVCSNMIGALFRKLYDRSHQP